MISYRDWKKRALFTFTLLYLNFFTISALNNGLALKPPMGWITTQKYGCDKVCNSTSDQCLNENTLKHIAQRLVFNGWLEAGYEYLIVDDCWSSKTREKSKNELHADPARFNSSMQEFINYLHSQKLKLGLTIGSGPLTCLGYPGSLDHLKLDADTLGKWGVDYLRMTACNTDVSQMESIYEKFSNYITKSGHVVFSCTYPAFMDWQKNSKLINWDRIENICNSYRVFPDSQQPNKWESILAILNQYIHNSVNLAKHVKPGSWNDPDILFVGDPSLTPGQQRVQMGMWCMLAAPLMVSQNIDQIDNFASNLLKNQLLIAIDQDHGGHQAEFVKIINQVQLWTRKLVDKHDGFAVALVNVANQPVNLLMTFNDFESASYKFDDKATFTLIDVFDNLNMLHVKRDGQIQLSIGPQDIRIFRVLTDLISCNH